MFPNDRETSHYLDARNTFCFCFSICFTVNLNFQMTRWAVGRLTATLDCVRLRFRFPIYDLPMHGHPFPTRPLCTAILFQRRRRRRRRRHTLMRSMGSLSWASFSTEASSSKAGPTHPLKTSATIAPTSIISRTIGKSKRSRSTLFSVRFSYLIQRAGGRTNSCE